MRDRVIAVLAIVLAAMSWWGLYLFAGQVLPIEPGARTFFFAVLFAASTLTLVPVALVLNRRFAPEAYERDPWRLLRHSAWGGLCITSWAWLQMLGAFNPAFALIIAMIFVAVEVLIIRLKGAA
jgi:hypothetical protein